MSTIVETADTQSLPAVKKVKLTHNPSRGDDEVSKSGTFLDSCTRILEILVLFLILWLVLIISNRSLNQALLYLYFIQLLVEKDVRIYEYSSAANPHMVQVRKKLLIEAPNAYTHPSLL